MTKVSISDMENGDAPSPDGIRGAIDLIRETVADSEGDTVLNMDNPRIERDSCGTTACFGGWFALAVSEHPGEVIACNPLPARFERAPVTIGDTHWLTHLDPEKVCFSGGTVTFEDGADAFAREVSTGGMLQHELENWFHERPDLWGNQYGGSMFADASAYGYCMENMDDSSNACFESSEPVNIWQVCDHWMAVADRLEAAIESNKGESA